MVGKKSTVGSKVTARADSTGMENDNNVIIKHHHSVKKMQTPSVRKRIWMFKKWIFILSSRTKSLMISY